MTTSISDWHALAADIEISGEAFIDGDHASTDGTYVPQISPVDGRHLTRVADGGEAGIDSAVASARRVFEAGTWALAHPRERRRKMLAWAGLVRERRERLALLVTLEMGKPITSALGEVDYAAGVLEFYAEAIDKTYGEIAPTGPEALATITKEPLGVIGAVLPWNFPISLAAWKLGPALATGNSCIVKPAEQSPLSALYLARLATEAGIPDGVLNVVPGAGEVTGRALGRHMDVDAITFTGSSQVGKYFLAYSAHSNMKAVSIEGGGKSPNIVLADAPDLDRAAQVAADGICGNAGQSCSAPSRLLVDRAVADEFVPRVADQMARWRPADPLDPDTTLGSVADKTQMERVLGFVDRAREAGARVDLGGDRARAESGGFYVNPTLVSVVSNSMEIAQEEVFGPVLTVLEFNGLEEAISIANGTRYGLAAAIWTRDVSKAHRTARALRAGTIYVNCYDDSDINVTFGGFKESGIGVDKSLHAMDKYTQFKTTWLDLGA